MRRLHPLARPRAHPLRRARQRGAALLIALLTVTLVATFAATALWQQWRATEIEAAERARLQSAWVLVGALDWSRLILREDAREVDFLGEPWSIPLAEARLSSFLAADRNISADALEGLPDAFLSGRILDAQGKLNVRNLATGGKPDEAAILAFQQLFQMLGLPPEQVLQIAAGMGAASPASLAGRTPPPADLGDVNESSDGALMPQRVRELAWFGLPLSTIEAIEPYVTVLPARTKLNLNTASAEALAASVPELDLASAQRVVAHRQRSFFRSVAEANEVLRREDGPQFNEGMHGVASQYFEVMGRLRLDRYWVEEQSLVQRVNFNLTVLWRQRGTGVTPVIPAP